MKYPKVLLVFIVVQLVLFIILAGLILTSNKQVSIKGDKGDSAVVDYKLLKDYVQEEISNIPRPANGVDGMNATDEQVAQAVAAYLSVHPPAAGVNGTNGIDGQPGAQGETGATGPAAPKYQERCKDFANKKSQIQWKYENEETWKLLYELPHKCNGDLF